MLCYSLRHSISHFQGFFNSDLQAGQPNNVYEEDLHKSRKKYTSKHWRNHTRLSALSSVEVLRMEGPSILEDGKIHLQGFFNSVLQAGQPNDVCEEDPYNSRKKCTSEHWRNQTCLSAFSLGLLRMNVWPSEDFKPILTLAVNKTLFQWSKSQSKCVFNAILESKAAIYKKRNIASGPRQRTRVLM